jgi:DNA invertase Pin-like site-specific DNA recombinase
MYARVSGDRQKRDGTILNQLKLLPDWIKSQGWDLVGEYTDDGKSASKNIELRGGLAQLRLDAGRGIYDVVVFVDLDRVSRTDQWGEFGPIMGDFQVHGIKIASPTTGVLTLGDGASDMMIFMRWQIAAQDNKKRVSVLMVGKRRAALRGCHVQGPTPYGLTWRTGARDASGWGIDETKAALVREIFERAVRGESGHQIAALIESRGTPGPQVNEKHPKGGRWKEPVIRILRSPVYRGLHRWNDVPITVPRIVDDETWYAAQTALGVSKKKGIGQPLHLYLCNGLAVCSSCGSPMYVAYKDGPGGKRNVRKYVCKNSTARRVVGAPRCKLPSFDQARTDALIWAEVAGYLSRPTTEILSDLRGVAAEADAEAQAWVTDAEKYAAQLTELDAAEKAMLDMLMSGLVTAAGAKERLTHNAARRARIQSMLQTAQDAVNGAGASATAARDLATTIDDLRTLCAKANDRHKRDLVRTLVVRGGITFDAHGCNVRLAFSRGEDGGSGYLPEIVQGTCDGSMVKNPSQLPGENVVVLRVVSA